MQKAVLLLLVLVSNAFAGLQPHHGTVKELCELTKELLQERYPSPGQKNNNGNKKSKKFIPAYNKWASYLAPEVLNQLDEPSDNIILFMETGFAYILFPELNSQATTQDDVTRKQEKEALQAELDKVSKIRILGHSAAAGWKEIDKIKENFCRLIILILESPELVLLQSTYHAHYTAQKQKHINKSDRILTSATATTKVIEFCKRNNDQKEIELKETDFYIRRISFDLDTFQTGAPQFWIGVLKERNNQPCGFKVENGYLTICIDTKSRYLKTNCYSTFNIPVYVPAENSLAPLENPTTITDRQTPTQTMAPIFSPESPEENHNTTTPERDTQDEEEETANGEEGEQDEVEGKNESITQPNNKSATEIDREQDEASGNQTKLGVLEGKSTATTTIPQNKGHVEEDDADDDEEETDGRNTTTGQGMGNAPLDEKQLKTETPPSISSNNNPNDFSKPANLGPNGSGSDVQQMAWNKGTPDPTTRNNKNSQRIPFNQHRNPDIITKSADQIPTEIERRNTDENQKKANEELNKKLYEESQRDHELLKFNRLEAIERVINNFREKRIDTVKERVLGIFIEINKELPSGKSSRELAEKEVSRVIKNNEDLPIGGLAKLLGNKRKKHLKRRILLFRMDDSGTFDETFEEKLGHILNVEVKCSKGFGAEIFKTDRLDLQYFGADIQEDTNRPKQLVVGVVLSPKK